MASADILSITHLLEEIKRRSDFCLKTNEQTQILIGRLTSRNPKESCCQSTETLPEIAVKCWWEDMRSSKAPEDLEPLENILIEKLQENARLKMLNERLVLNSRQKSHKIKELMRQVSSHSHQIQKAKEISSYKDKVGRCNVEIQKLKKLLGLETKKLRNEKAKVSRMGMNHDVSDERFSESVEEVIKKVPLSKKLKTNNQQQEPTRASFKDLDEVYIQKTLKMIKLSGELDLNNETLDEPENLDSDTDEMTKDSTDEAISKESTDIDIESLS